MKAAVYTRYGPPEVVSVQVVEKPVLKSKEVLIKVHATTVNRTDCGFRSAEYFISRLFSGLFRPKNKILGCEFAGEIECVGSAVTKFAVGDNVFGFNDKSCGGHAEYLVIDEEESMAVMPGNMRYTEAAPITEGAHYALCNLRAAKVSAGHNVFIYGATGAIGSAAVQLAKYMGAQVTAVCDTNNLRLVQGLGADKTIDYLEEDFTKISTKFNFIFDAVGKSSFKVCKPLLVDTGIYISTELGKNNENIFLSIASIFRKGKRVLFPIPSISQEDVLFLKKLVEEEKFNPVIDRYYSLQQIREAYQYVETGQKTGNVVIRIYNPVIE